MTSAYQQYSLFYVEYMNRKGTTLLYVTQEDEGSPTGVFIPRFIFVYIFTLLDMLYEKK